MPKRVLCSYGIDVDAVSGWINTRDGKAANPTDVSRGVFGATVGIDRLLKLWEKYNIKTTWFVWTRYISIATRANLYNIAGSLQHIL
jgi:hypothetical protein